MACAPNRERLAATMSEARNHTCRFIAETPSLVSVRRGSSRAGIPHTLFRNENSLATRCSQLEHEAKTSMEAQPVEVHFLAHGLPEGRIEELGLGRARVPDRFAVEPGRWADIQVHAA